MKMSPFFKVFEEEAAAWDDKLNRIRALLDVWIDVQRRWVYLEVCIPEAIFCHYAICFPLSLAARVGINIFRRASSLAVVTLTSYCLKKAKGSEASTPNSLT